MAPHMLADLALFVPGQSSAIRAEDVPALVGPTFQRAPHRGADRAVPMLAAVRRVHGRAFRDAHSNRSTQRGCWTHFSHPLPPCPHNAPYKGSGDTNDTKNYACIEDWRPPAVRPSL